MWKSIQPIQTYSRDSLACIAAQLNDSWLRGCARLTGDWLEVHRMLYREPYALFEHRLMPIACQFHEIGGGSLEIS